MRWAATAFLGVMVAGAVSANAADLRGKAPIYKAPPPVASYNWTGFDVGANVGYGWNPYQGFRHA